MEEFPVFSFARNAGCVLRFKRTSEWNASFQKNVDNPSDTSRNYTIRRECFSEKCANRCCTSRNYARSLVYIETRSTEYGETRFGD